MKNSVLWPALVTVLILAGVAEFNGIFMQGAPAQVWPDASPVHTTLQEIMAGRFPSATDKHGTAGVLVRVDNLTVLYVRDQLSSTGIGTWP